MQGLLVELLRSIQDLPGAFADAATADPLSAVLLAIGGLIIGVASAVFGGLTIGALVSLVTPN